MQSRWSIPSICTSIYIHTYSSLMSSSLSNLWSFPLISNRKWDLLPSHYCEHWQIACQTCHSLHKYIYIENKIDIILNTTTYTDDQYIIIKLSFSFFSLNTHHEFVTLIILSHFTFNLNLVWYETHSYTHAHTHFLYRLNIYVKKWNKKNIEHSSIVN